MLCSAVSVKVENDQRQRCSHFVSASLTRLDVSRNYLDRGGDGKGQGVKLLRDAVGGREGFVLIDDDNT